jgi:hypothetical protein
VSHPFRRKKRKGWGTEDYRKIENALRSVDQLAVASEHAYATIAGKIKDRAALRKVEYLRDITTEMPDEWRDSVIALLASLTTGWG